MTTWLDTTQSGETPCYGAGSWLAHRYETVRTLLRSRFRLTDTSVINRAAALVVAHWRLETGCGRYEHNHNPSGIHCGGFSTCTRVGAEELRAYTSIEEGARDYLETIHEHYPSAWNLLTTPVESYFPDLARLGWVDPGAARDSAIRDWPAILARTLGELRLDPWWTLGSAEQSAYNTGRSHPGTTQRRRSRGGALPVIILGIGAYLLLK